MAKFDRKYSESYNEEEILWLYRENVNNRIIRSTLYSCSFYLIVVGGYFIFSDIFVRNISQDTILWRIPSLCVAMSMLILRRTNFRNNIQGMFILYNSMLFLLCLMMAGITWGLSDTDLFQTSINGTIVAMFVVYVGTYGGIKILAINFSPIYLMVIFYYFYFDAPIEKMVEFGNIIGLMVGCLSVSQVEESLRFKEFRSRKIVEEEQKRSNSLLLNILPQEMADEIKLTGKVEAKKFDFATVLFTDFKEFTRIAETLRPEILVKSIDFYFSAFDLIVEKYNLEKIKTIGDSYMCVGGLPTSSSGHAERAVQAAMEMLEFVRNVNPEAHPGIQKFDIRIGIHSGPVIAGVVGIKKFQYDVWGDTVNIASRMESVSEAGRINISEATFKQLTNGIHCQFRGVHEVKNHGKLAMYFVEAPELSEV